MFGFPMPDLGDMVNQINDFKEKFERLVAATEENTRKLDLIINHLQLNEVRDAEFSVSDENEYTGG